jgi:heme exporter protein CcmD
MTHLDYIVTAYGFTSVVVGALIVWTLVQARAQRAALTKLEGRK